MSKDDTNLFDFAWGKIIGAGIFFVIAYWLHGTFSELEAGTRESVRLNWIAALLYRLTGHELTVGIFAGIGVIALIFGVRQLIAEKG
jgi:hypothetical protein